MALVQQATNGLYKGVTKQEVSNRVDGQVSESINMLHTVERGISRRNPTKFISALNISADDSFIHSYARGDGIEEYIIVIQNGNIKVITTTGIEVAVTKSAEALAYLQTSESVVSAYRALTVGDTTFIVNKHKVVRMSGVRENNAGIDKAYPFYWVSKSFNNGLDVGYDYNLMGTSANSVKTTTACSKIASQLGAPYHAYGSIVVRDGNAGSWTWSDSYGSQASQGFWGTATKIEELPATMSGADIGRTFLIKIQGDADNAFTAFWVKYSVDHWQETVAPNLDNYIKNSTMPIKLVRQDNGTFDLSLLSYEPRKFGDELTASVPSFVGNTISDIFFFKNRLCLVSNENVIMSEVGEYYNFFPTTVTAILESDPIDVAVDSNSVALLNHAIPFNNSVILLSSSAQFSLQSDKVLSPNDVSISTTTSYDAVQVVRPLPLGSALYFLSETLEGTALREYYVDDSGTSNRAVDISGHVRGYLPKNIVNMVGNTNQDIICMLSKNEANSIYVYKFYTDGDKRIQTAFFKWTFSGTICNITMLNDYLYIIINRGNGIQLEKIDYSSAEYTSYLDNGTIPYTSEITISEPTLKDSNGKLIQSGRSPLMYKTLQLKSTEESKYKVQITNKINTRIAKSFAVNDNKIMVTGKTSDVTLKIISVEGEPLEFHTYTTELNYNMRAKIV